jgi:hypothetical protein
MVATWIVTIVRPSPRLRWAVPAEALILIATHLAGLGWPA